MIPTTESKVNTDPQAAAEKMVQFMVDNNIPIPFAIKAGKLAETALKSKKDKKSYKAYVDYMVSRNAATKKDLATPNPQQMGFFAAMGNIASMLKQAKDARGAE